MTIEDTVLRDSRGRNSCYKDCQKKCVYWSRPTGPLGLRMDSLANMGGKESRRQGLSLQKGNE